MTEELLAEISILKEKLRKAIEAIPHTCSTCKYGVRPCGMEYCSDCEHSKECNEMQEHCENNCHIPEIDGWKWKNE